MTLKPIPFSKYDDTGAYHWDECERYSRRYNPPLEARYRAIAKRITQASRVLDVGCGDGYLMSLVSPRCGQVLGIDTELTGVKLAASKLRQFPNCNVTWASSYELPFRDRCFEVVLLADVIEHLENPGTCLREIVRVMATDGMLFVTTPKRQPARPLGWGHVKEYTPGELIECLRSYFAEVCTTFFWPSTWFSLYGTKVGWRLIRLFARYCYNPFVEEGPDHEDYDQILAICSHPH